MYIDPDRYNLGDDDMATDCDPAWLDQVLCVMRKHDALALEWAELRVTLAPVGGPEPRKMSPEELQEAEDLDTFGGGGLIPDWPAKR
jgi:hypothetical protein